MKSCLARVRWIAQPDTRAQAHVTRPQCSQDVAQERERPRSEVRSQHAARHAIRVPHDTLHASVRYIDAEKGIPFSHQVKFSNADESIAEVRDQVGDIDYVGGRADLLALTYMSLLVGVAAISGAFGLFASVAATMGPLASLIGLFGIPLLLTRFVFGRTDGRQRDRLEHLTMELLRIAEESSGDGRASGDDADR